MSNIINNFEITNDLTITDGTVQVKTNNINGSLDISGNIAIGSSTSDNSKLIVENINNSIIELKANNANDNVSTKSITNKSGVLEFSSNASLNTCLYEFNVGDNDSVGFMNSIGNNKPGIVFGRAGTVSLSVNDYSNAHIFYSTEDGGSDYNALNFTGEKFIFNTSSENFNTLSQAMIIDANGNVGMGTSTSPTVSFEVGATDAIRIPYGTTEQRPLTDASGCIRYNTTLKSFEGFGAGSTWGSLGGVKDVDQDTYISAETKAGDDNDQLKFYTAQTEKMIIDKNGSVGIGTTSPRSTNKLEVNGDLRVGSSDSDSPNNNIYLNPSNGVAANKNGLIWKSLTYSSYNNVYSAAIYFQPEKDAYSGGLSFWTKETSSGNLINGNWVGAEGVKERMRINRFGKVGIGTPSPSTKLHILDDGTGSYNAIPLLLESSINNYVVGQHSATSIQFKLKGGGGSIEYNFIGQKMGGNYVYGIGIGSGLDVRTATNSLWVESNKVGIGTTAPSEKLEVDGNIKADALHLTTLVGLKPGTGGIILGNLTGSATAVGEYSVSAGQNNISTGKKSVAMGQSNTSEGGWSIAIGHTNKSFGIYSVAMGQGNNSTVASTGQSSVAMGQSNTSTGNYSVAMGLSNTSTKSYSVAMGESNTSTGTWSVAMGASNQSQGNYSVAMGQSNKSPGINSFAMGKSNNSGGSSGAYSVAMGLSNTSGGSSSVAMGNSNTSGGYSSVAMGQSNTSTGQYSVAMGESNTSSHYSVAMGHFNHAEKNYSVALGNRAWAGDNIRFAIGISDIASTTKGINGSNNNKFVIDKDGNVRSGDLNTIMNDLIGSELNSKLHIQGGGISIYQNNTWNGTSEAQEALIYLDVNNGGTKSGIQWKPLYQHTNPKYTKDSAGIYFQPEGNSGFQGGLSFWTNNSPYQTVAGQERMRIDKNGNVGIGTATPTYKLQIKGAKDEADKSCQLMIENDSYNKGIEFRYKSSSGSQYDFPQAKIYTSWGDSNYDTKLHFSTASGTSNASTIAVEVMTMDSLGRVGIGTTAPQRTFHLDGQLTVRSGTQEGLLFWNAPNNTYMDINKITGTTGSSTPTIRFHTASHSYFNGGNVGIGTTSPGFKLDVNGNGIFRAGLQVRIETAYGTYPLNVHAPPNPTHGLWPTQFYNGARYFESHDSSLQMDGADAYWKTTGNQIGIYTNGGIMGQRIMAKSDKRIKENIRDVSDNLSLQKLRDISCCYYEYKDKISSGGLTTIGFIAQQVREHMPIAVSLQKMMIPNEMRVIETPQWTTMTDASGNNKCKLTIVDLEDVSGNTKYKFYVSNDLSYNDECEKEITSLENDPKSFIFEEKWQNVFLYGKEVDDFHTIDKAKIFALNFSASQEIDRIQQQEKAKLTEQEAKLATAEAKLATAETEITTLKNNDAVLLNKIATLESNFYNLQQQVQALINH